ncbi:hypothetical protein [Serratia fonticola]|uniref:Uncharacterized protein n=1 Tax=Serratia fonticola TaxID=47917 RepID=A0AAE7EIP4_SERFO|nr:hypothetical protein [Serratia fonticola]NCG50832.1 hypothetical protein [Serratia fonticola]QKJ59367.1 hypothetical protein G9399_14790 [Serratia fonticola]
MDWVTIVVSLLSAFVGTFFGTQLIKRANNKKIEGVRDTAISCLEKIKSYCKNENDYQSVQSEFNNAFPIASKRAVLVALHKIGIPIEFAAEQAFNIKFVSFLPEKINKTEIEDMITQIKSGQCDHLFFLDPETYFNEGSVARKKRAVAIKYIEIAIKDSTGKDEETHFLQRFPEGWHTYFSPGEMNVIGVFKKKLCNPYYYKLDGQVKTAELEKLKEEVRLGMWDFYLSWDVEAFDSMNSQRMISEKTAGAIDILMNISPWNTKQN